MSKVKELTVIQKMTDYIDWVSPLINRFPKDKKFTIGDRLLNKLYSVLELLIKSKYGNNVKPLKRLGCFGNFLSPSLKRWVAIN